MESLNEYVDLCRRIGPWTDWVQGPGGNISIKTPTEMIVKASGSLIAETTAEQGYTICKLADIEAALNNGQPLPTLNPKPSIEIFLHALPARIIVHLHPAPLLNKLCSTKIIPNSITIPYYKPGIELARFLQEKWSTDIPIYFLQNHGIIICGNTIDEIIEHMIAIKHTHFTNEPTTNIQLASTLFDIIKKHTNEMYLIKPIFRIYNTKSSDRLFLPFTPDIVVFLQTAPLVFETGDEHIEEEFLKYQRKYGCIPTVIFTSTFVYTISKTLGGCYAISEILYSYCCIDSQAEFLADEQVSELVNWDAEKERRQKTI